MATPGEVDLGIPEITVPTSRGWLKDLVRRHPGYFTNEAFNRYLEAEAEATQLNMYAGKFFPGLLQNRLTAERVIEHFERSKLEALGITNPELLRRRVNLGVSVRLGRQALMESGVIMRFYINAQAFEPDEAIVSPQIMAANLRELWGFINNNRARVELGVVAVQTAQLALGPDADANVTLLTLPDGGRFFEIERGAGDGTSGSEPEDVDDASRLIAIARAASPKRGESMTDNSLRYIWELAQQLDPQ